MSERPAEPPAGQPPAGQPPAREPPASEPPFSSWTELESQLLARPRSRGDDAGAVRDRVAQLLIATGRPQRALSVIHITGTNGKTTTAQIIDSLLSAAGLTVARFTGPHLQATRERMTVAGVPISEPALLAAHARLAPALDQLDAEAGPLPYFATLTALTLTAFGAARPDVAIVEVGIGGVFDATNVVNGEVAVICPVAMDHADRLGDSLAAIARHKAGIIKPGSSAVIAAQSRGVTRILRAHAGRVGAEPIRVERTLKLHRRRAHPGGQILGLEGYGALHHGLVLPLLGRHQADNAMTAIVAAQTFLARRNQTLGRDALRRGLAGATSPGRLERVCDEPCVVIDAAHNPAGMTASAAALGEAFGARRPVVVFATARDKDAAGMLAALAPYTSAVVLTRWGSRGSDPRDLAQLATGLWSEVAVVDDLGDAVRHACATSQSGVLVSGSIAAAGAARELFGARLRAG